MTTVKALKWFSAINRHGSFIQFTLWTSTTETTYVIYANFLKPSVDSQTEESAIFIKKTKSFLSHNGVEVETVIHDGEFPIEGTCLSIRNLSIYLVSLLQTADILDMTKLPDGPTLLSSHETFLGATPNGSIFEKLASKNHESTAVTNRRDPHKQFDSTIFKEEVVAGVVGTIKRFLRSDVMPDFLKSLFGFCQELNFPKGNVLDAAAITKVNIFFKALLYIFNYIYFLSYFSWLTNSACI